MSFREEDSEKMREEEKKYSSFSSEKGFIRNIDEIPHSAPVCFMLTNDVLLFIIQNQVIRLHLSICSSYSGCLVIYQVKIRFYLLGKKNLSPLRCSVCLVKT